MRVGVLFPEPSIQFLVGDDSGILAKEVFTRLKFLAARSDNGDTVLDDFRLGSVLNGGLEVADKPFHMLDGTGEVDLNLRVVHHFLSQPLSIGANLFAAPGLVEVEGLTAELRRLLHQIDGIALIGERFGGHHAGHAAANHQGFPGDAQLRFLQRFQQHDLGHRHAHEVFGLFRGSDGIACCAPRNPGCGYWPSRTDTC